MKTYSKNDIRRKMLEHYGEHPSSPRELQIEKLCDSGGTVVAILFVIEGTPEKGHGVARPTDRGYLLNLYGPTGRRWKANEACNLDL